MASTSIRRCSIRRPISICSIATPTSGRCAARCGTPSRTGRTPGSGSSRRAPAPPPRSSGPRSWRYGFATSTRSTPWKARTRRWPPSGGCSPTPSASTAWRPRATRSCTTGTAPRWTSSTGCGGGWRSSRASTASSRRTSRRGTRCGPTSRSWRTRCGRARAGRRRRPGGYRRSRSGWRSWSASSGATARPSRTSSPIATGCGGNTRSGKGRPTSNRWKPPPRRRENATPASPARCPGAAARRRASWPSPSRAGWASWRWSARGSRSCSSRRRKGRRPGRTGESTGWRSTSRPIPGKTSGRSRASLPAASSPASCWRCAR